MNLTFNCFRFYNMNSMLRHWFHIVHELFCSLGSIKFWLGFCLNWPLLFNTLMLSCLILVLFWRNFLISFRKCIFQWSENNLKDFTHQCLPWIAYKFYYLKYNMDAHLFLCNEKRFLWLVRSPNEWFFMIKLCLSYSEFDNSSSLPILSQMWIPFL